MLKIYLPKFFPPPRLSCESAHEKAAKQVGQNQ
jgi:hypothetical protein